MALDNLRVASPCPISWDAMVGDDRVRFCKHCELNVYNFSELTRKEAEALLVKTNGRLCGRLYRRSDGTVLTKDCPVGLRALRKRVSRRAVAIFATLVGIGSAVFGQSSSKDKKDSCTPQVRIMRIHKAAGSQANVLTGTVLDVTGAAIPAARIVVKDASTSELKSAVTGDDGAFRFSGLAEGRYLITINATGFKLLKIIDFKVENNFNLNTQFTLELANETVTVGIIATSSMLDLPPGSFTMSGDVLRMLPH